MGTGSPQSARSALAAMNGPWPTACLALAGPPIAPGAYMATSVSPPGLASRKKRRVDAPGGISSKILAVIEASPSASRIDLSAVSWVSGPFKLSTLHRPRHGRQRTLGDP